MSLTGWGERMMMMRMIGQDWMRIYRRKDRPMLVGRGGERMSLDECGSGWVVGYDSCYYDCCCYGHTNAIASDAVALLPMADHDDTRSPHPLHTPKTQTD